MDDIYQVYVSRVAHMTLPEAYLSQLEHIQESPKYRLEANGTRIAVPFPGYSVITCPAGESTQNQGFYQNLKTCQHQLEKILGTDLLISVPPESLHLTLADLIWDSSYEVAVQQLLNLTRLRRAIAQSFTAFTETQTQAPAPIAWQVFGLLVMARAIGVCLVPRDESAYDTTVQIRRMLYQNSDLMALGIEQQYHFTAHITLGYFGKISPELNREKISQALADLNSQWIDSPQELSVHRVELRKFDDMTQYYREPDWPTLRFDPD
ncbi:MAG: DUF1868 domain-containing protein [Oscillatoriales cyanobacterium RM1_1_9]|nr:DUF1868 domain-containing protein [Oscillatoriales cyanobacterium RM1_1_9]